jgi:hypothetical protein
MDGVDIGALGQQKREIGKRTETSNAPKLGTKEARRDITIHVQLCADNRRHTASAPSLTLLHALNEQHGRRGKLVTSVA